MFFAQYANRSKEKVPAPTLVVETIGACGIYPIFQFGASLVLGAAMSSIICFDLTAQSVYEALSDDRSLWCSNVANEAEPSLAMQAASFRRGKSVQELAPLMSNWLDDYSGKYGGEWWTYYKH